jgi:hypothetical protein
VSVEEFHAPCRRSRNGLALLQWTEWTFLVDTAVGVVFISVAGKKTNMSESVLVISRTGVLVSP